MKIKIYMIKIWINKSIRFLFKTKHQSMIMILKICVAYFYGMTSIGLKRNYYVEFYAAQKT